MTALPRRPLWSRALANEAAEFAVMSAETAGLPPLKDLYLGGMHFPELSFASLADVEAWQQHGEIALLIETYAAGGTRVRYAQLFPYAQAEPHWMVEVTYPTPPVSEPEPSVSNAAFWAEAGR